MDKPRTCRRDSITTMGQSGAYPSMQPNTGSNTTRDMDILTPHRKPVSIKHVVPEHAADHEEQLCPAHSVKLFQDDLEAFSWRLSPARWSTLTPSNIIQHPQRAQLPKVKLPKLQLSQAIVHKSTSDDISQIIGCHGQRAYVLDMEHAPGASKEAS
ncbi:hypothetical protein BC567DRAFT_284087 [Phyllosticta citribraziliensis]